MNGRSPIVLVTANHRFCEHVNIESAHGEAKRLASMTGYQAVVYVPVALVQPPHGPFTEHLPAIKEIAAFTGDDLPF